MTYRIGIQAWHPPVLKQHLRRGESMQSSDLEVGLKLGPSIFETLLGILVEYTARASSG